ncbi:protein NUCLEAR FUSION DEFECTIVE 4-like [Populus alba x Populus x berolinensis]|uniref:Protein NUCLEAR FUSION DEFECTIVE 4-like n=1 Tax=Populus alba x Populus x berolinensis TaxID=444605 RepID=A0AAD6LYY2_9ROSI|nr:protein NUCLEAR FUSION DEFECTIVE 4-like [Populus alba x Populus x berolinensis]
MGNNQLKFRLSSWLTLGCITLLQASSAPRFIFSACASLMEQNYHISHVQLNNLIVASETGRLFGFVSTAAATCFPAWMILFIGLVFGLVGYGVQCFCISHRIPALSFWQALLLNILAGNSSCWINTYCQLLATRNFKDSYRTIFEITSTYSGLSGKILTSLVEGIEGRKGSTNSMIEPVAPFFGFVSLRLRAVILALALTIPFAVALLTAAADRFSEEKYHSQVTRRESNDSGESNPEKVSKEVKIAIGEEREADQRAGGEVDSDDKGLFKAGNDAGMKKLLLNVDFWMFYLVNACGPTLGMVYLNNLERITQSRSMGEASFLLEISSAFGFFGRILSIMFHWYTREKSVIANPALTVLLMIPMPIAVFLLLDSNRCLYISTGILGTCSGALIVINSMTTSELFGSKNSVAKQTIVLTNIPLGSLLFGYLAAINYQSEGAGDHGVCIGLQCYQKTFIIWGSICFTGTILSFLLHLRTQNLYSQKSFSVGN